MYSNHFLGFGNFSLQFAQIAVHMEGFLPPLQGDVVALVECWYRSGVPGFVDSCNAGKQEMAATQLIEGLNMELNMKLPF